MDTLHSAGSALLIILDPIRMGYLFGGVCMGLALGILPGIGGVAGLALLLAAIGIYGLIANSVVERTRELGIRMALGATVSQAMKTVAIAGVLLAAAGVAIGCALARAASQVLRSFVWGVSAADPLTFVAAAAGLLLVAMLASFIPALRVLRLDPAHTLRHE